MNRALIYESFVAEVKEIIFYKKSYHLIYVIFFFFLSELYLELRYTTPLIFSQNTEI